MTDVEVGADLALQDHVLVETEIGGRTVGFRVVVVKVSPTELWLGLATPDHRLLSLDPGQKVRLTVGRPGYALIGESEFVRHLGESHSRVFAVVQSPRLERTQRRSQARIDVQMEVRLRRIDPATGEARGKGASGMTVNASPGGLLLETDMDVAVGDDLEITIRLSGDDRISASGRVTRLRELGDPAQDGRPMLSVAVKFTRMTAVDQRSIMRHCFLLEHRRQIAGNPGPGAGLIAGSSMSPASTTAGAPMPAAAQTPATAGPPDPAPRGTTSPAPAGGGAPASGSAANAAALAAAVAMAMKVMAARPNGTTSGAASGAATAASAAPAAGSSLGAPAVKPDPVKTLLAEMRPDAPLVEVGLSLCQVGNPKDVCRWFDALMPFDRISLLSQLQANVHGEAVPGAVAGGAQPLAHALGLL